MRFPSNLNFWDLKWGKIFYESLQNPSKTPMSLISENQLINFDLAKSYFYFLNYKINIYLISKYFFWTEVHKIRSKTQEFWWWDFDRLVNAIGVPN